MKQLSTLLLLVFIQLSAFSQTWSQVSNLPLDSLNDRMAASAFSFSNGDAFVLGGIKLVGSTWVVFDDVWTYDKQIDLWAPNSAFPGGKRYAHVAFVINNVAYVGLGADENGNAIRDLWALDMQTGLWNKKANFPGTGRVYSSTMTVGGKGYVAGGIRFDMGNAIYLKENWEYDPQQDQWTQKADLPGVMAGTVMFSINDKGYLGFGERSGFFEFGFYEYNSQGDQWTSLSGAPSTPISFASAEVVNGKAYIIGGENAHLSYTDEVWEFDPNGNTWTSYPPFIGRARRNAVTFTIDNTIYYGSGQHGTDETEVEADFYSFTLPVANSIQNHQSEVEIVTYPNPVHDILRLHVSSDETINQIQVYSDLGNNVPIQSNQVEEQYELDFSELPAGIYHIHVSLESGKVMKTIINE